MREAGGGRGWLDVRGGILFLRQYLYGFSFSNGFLVSRVECWFCDALFSVGLLCFSLFLFSLYPFPLFSPFHLIFLLILSIFSPSSLPPSSISPVPYLLSLIAYPPSLSLSHIPQHSLISFTTLSLTLLSCTVL